MFRFVCLLLVLGSLEAARAAPSAEAFNQIVETRIRAQIADLLDQLIAQERAMQIDGQPVFSGDDKFLPGKIALAFADTITSLPADDPRRARLLEGFRRVASLTIDDPNDSWGIYYYLSGLNQLARRGLLDGALDPLVFAKLRVRLDWRTFVDTSTYQLIDHPNNYYCVAFAIARLRHRLGWEKDDGVDKLFAAMIAHYEKYSGASGFADETQGEGRFDRYSVLLAAEIAQRFMETDGLPPRQVIDWVRKSADVMLMRLNAQGAGFEYGRSLGPYGETAIVEVLTAAAKLGVLTDQEKSLAYAFASRVARRYVDFWIDARTGSVNLWGGGRRTDAYRGKFRILGENLSLGHHFLYTNEAWNALGFKDVSPRADFVRALRSLPTQAVTWFARGDYDRLLVTLRDRGQLIGLPLINGGPGQHMNSPYFPIPFSNGLLNGVADAAEPLLVPRFELADGTVLMPLAFFRGVKVEQSGDRTVVSWHQTESDRMGKRDAIADPRLQVETRYEFSRGMITRTDTYRAAQPLEIRQVRIELASYSSGPRTTKLATTFTHGALREFRVGGFESCESIGDLDDARYRGNDGPFASRVACSLGKFRLDEPITLSWQLRYEVPAPSP
jgi:hypothetical protein